MADHQNNIPPRLSRTAEFRAASYHEADNSIEVVWTTGAAVRRRDWRNGEYFLETLEVTPKAVRLDRLNAGASFLDTHDDSSLRSILGSVIPGSAKIEGGVGIARIRLSNAPGDADTVSKIRDGIIRNISVGYAIHRAERREFDDGRDTELRVVDWEPLEISAVPIPADAGAQVRGAEGVDGAEAVISPVIVDMTSSHGLVTEFDVVRALLEDDDDDDILTALEIAAEHAADISKDPLERADAALDEATRILGVSRSYIAFGAALAWASKLPTSGKASGDWTGGRQMFRPR